MCGRADEQPFGERVQQILDGTGTGQMQDDALFCLADLDRDLEQLVDDRRRLRLASGYLSRKQ